MLQSVQVASSRVRNPGAFSIEIDLLGFDLSKCEKGKTCSTWPKFDLSIFGLCVVNLVMQRAASLGKLKKLQLTQSSTKVLLTEAYSPVYVSSAGGAGGV